MSQTIAAKFCHKALLLYLVWSKTQSVQNRHLQLQHTGFLNLLQQRRS